MKTDWKLGDRFYYCINKDSKERGYLAGKVEVGTKLTINECIGKDCVVSDGWVFYFDEIKPIIKIKGECNEVH